MGDAGSSTITATVTIISFMNYYLKLKKNDRP